MMSSIRWLPLESNPDVMNKFLRSLGVPEKWGVTDIIAFDEEHISMIPQPCLAVMLLFPVSEKYRTYCEVVETLLMEKQDDCDGIYFMKQTIGNACGTIALIHALANNEQYLNLKQDSVLKKFLDSTRDLSPEEKGKALKGNADISLIHEEVAQEGQTEANKLKMIPDEEKSGEKVNLLEESKKGSGQDDAPSTYEDEGNKQHFITFAEIGDKVVELDGLKSAPVIHNATNAEKFMWDACQICKDYIARDPENVYFHAMALGEI